MLSVSVDALHGISAYVLRTIFDVHVECFDNLFFFFMCRKLLDTLSKICCGLHAPKMSNLFRISIAQFLSLSRGGNRSFKSAQIHIFHTHQKFLSAETNGEKLVAVSANG